MQQSLLRVIFVTLTAFVVCCFRFHGGLYSRCDSCAVAYVFEKKSDVGCLAGCLWAATLPTTTVK